MNSRCASLGNADHGFWSGGLVDRHCLTAASAMEEVLTLSLAANHSKVAQNEVCRGGETVWP